MSTTQGFKGLKAWQKSVELVESVYRVTKSWPDDERFGLTNQIRRAAVSIPSNIAEGHGRASQGDFGRFVSIALGSLSEVETQIIIAERLGYISSEGADLIKSQCYEVGRVTQGLIKYVRQRYPSGIGEKPKPTGK